MNQFQALYEQLLAESKNILIKSRDLNDVAQLDFLKEIQKYINLEIDDLRSKSDYDQFEF